MGRIDMSGVLARLDVLQNPLDVESGRFVIVGQDVHGFGGQVSRRLLGLQIGLMLNRTVIFEKPNDPPYVTCFHPFAKYTFEDVSHLPASPLDFQRDQPDQAVRFDFESFWSNRQLRSRVGSWVPPEIASFACGRMLLEGLLASRCRLLNEFEQYVADAKRRIAFEPPIIGLHVRRGDKTVETPYVPLHALLQQVVSLSKQTGVRRVFVTSDSDKTFEELPRDLGLDFIHDPDEKRYDNANHLFLMSRPELQRQETLTAVKILELLSACDGVVGQDNAHFAKLAAARIVARTQTCDRHRLVRGDYAATFSGAPIRSWPKVLFYEKPRRSRAVLWALKASRPLRHRLGIRGGRWTRD